MLDASGIGTYLRELLPRVVDRWSDARFTVLGDPGGLSELPALERARVVSFDTPIYSVAEQLDFVRLIPRDTDLFWAPHYNMPLAYTGRLAVTVHDVNHLAIPQATLPKRLYARAMFAAVRGRASIVLADSHYTAAELLRLVGEPRRVSVVHLGVAPRWFAVPQPTADATPYFLCVGNVKPHKNLQRLLAAFAAVAPVIPHRLVIVGRREGLRTADEDVVTLATDLGDRVEFTGYLEQGALERCVAGCGALVLPSLYEGFGLPALEALACGRAVAVSGTTSLREVCGPHADYFDPLDVGSISASLLRLAHREPDTAEVRETRRAWVRRFDWDECARATVAALQIAAR